MFVILWEYEVKSECEESFRKVYGPEGPWVQLFRNDQQYKGTRLLRDALRSEACITMDQWESKQAYAKFKSTHMEEYAAIDREAQKLTLRERYLGAFSMNAEDYRTARLAARSEKRCVPIYVRWIERTQEGPRANVGPFCNFSVSQSEQYKLRCSRATRTACAVCSSVFRF
jgi:hypothetical protein